MRRHRLTKAAAAPRCQDLAALRVTFAVVTAVLCVGCYNGPPMQLQRRTNRITECWGNATLYDLRGSGNQRSWKADCNGQRYRCNLSRRSRGLPDAITWEDEVYCRRIEAPAAPPPPTPSVRRGRHESGDRFVRLRIPAQPVFLTFQTSGPEWQDVVMSVGRDALNTSCTVELRIDGGVISAPIRTSDGGAPMSRVHSLELERSLTAASLDARLCQSTWPFTDEARNALREFLQAVAEEREAGSEPASWLPD